MRRSFLLALFQSVEVSRKKLFSELTNDVIWEKLVRTDPTYKGGAQRGKYLPLIVELFRQWVGSLQNYLNSKDADNDQGISAWLDRLKTAVSNYDSYLRKGLIEGPERDMQHYMSKRNWRSFLQDWEHKVASLSDKEAIKEGAELVWTDGDWKLYKVNTYEASCALGGGTDWCVASRDEGTSTQNRRHFEGYKRNHGGDYYIAIHSSNSNVKDKIFFHIESNQVRGWNQKDKANWFEKLTVLGDRVVKDIVPKGLIDYLVSQEENYSYLYNQEATSREEIKFDFGPAVKDIQQESFSTMPPNNPYYPVYSNVFHLDESHAVWDKVGIYYADIDEGNDEELSVEGVMHKDRRIYDSLREVLYSLSDYIAAYNNAKNDALRAGRIPSFSPEVVFAWKEGRAKKLKSLLGG